MSTPHHSDSHALPGWGLAPYGLATAARAGLKLASAFVTDRESAVNPCFSVRPGQSDAKLVGKLVDNLSPKWSDWRVPSH